jgi:hypothetical protein
VQECRVFGPGESKARYRVPAAAADFGQRREVVRYPFLPYAEHLEITENYCAFREIKAALDAA